MQTDNYLYFSGIPTFGNYRHTRDLNKADIAVMGIPFEQGTTYRSGARFGARAVRAVSGSVFGFNYLWNTGGFSLDQACPDIIDYGDVGAFYGDRAARVMMEESYHHAKRILQSGASLMTLGGDHTIPYGPVRAVSEIYGKLALIHFDSHQDSIPGNGDYSHANFAYDLVQEGCIDPSHSVQACIRTDFDNCGYHIIYADEVRRIGAETLAGRIKEIVGDMPVYFTFDIDAIDPACAPGTGTPVCGGPSTGEVLDTLRALDGIHLVAADLVEVAPAYDHSEITAFAAAHVAQGLMCLMAKDRIRNGKSKL